MAPEQASQSMMAATKHWTNLVAAEKTITCRTTEHTARLTMAKATRTRAGDAVAAAARWRFQSLALVFRHDFTSDVCG